MAGFEGPFGHTRLRSALHHLQRRLPAHATARAHVEVSRKRRRIEGDSRPQLHDHDVVGLRLVGPAVADLNEILAAARKSPAIPEAGCQLEAVPRRADRNRDRGGLAGVISSELHSNLEQLLHRHDVFAVDQTADDHPRNPDPRQILPWWDHDQNSLDSADSLDSLDSPDSPDAEGTNATIRSGPPLPPVTFIGNATTKAPSAGS